MEVGACGFCACGFCACVFSAEHLHRFVTSLEGGGNSRTPFTFSYPLYIPVPF